MCMHWTIGGCFLVLQEDLPYTEDLDELGPLFEEVTPLDCPTPSSSRLTHPPSTLLSSEFARSSNVFSSSSPSVAPTVSSHDPPVITLDDNDDIDPPFGCVFLKKNMFFFEEKTLEKKGSKCFFFQKHLFSR